MFNNSTDKLLFLLEGEELNKAIVTSLDQSKNIILSLLGKKSIFASEVTSASKNPLRRATIFKFFEDHRDSNPTLFDEAWVYGVFKLSKQANLPIDELRRVFTKKGRHYEVTNVYRGALRQDAKLLMHLLWCNKAVLLPYGYPLPYSNGPSGEYASCSYPELLAIVRKPFVNNECLEKYPDLFIPPESKDNFFWYFKNFIRSSTWWKLGDVRTEDVKAILQSDLSASPSTKSQIQMLRTWLGFIAKSFPNGISFDLSKTFTFEKPLSNRNKLNSKSLNLSKNNLLSEGHFSFLPDKEKDVIWIWTKYLLLWEEKLSQKKVMSSEAKLVAASQVLTYFVNEVFGKKGYIPEPSEFSRLYLDGLAGELESLTGFLLEDRSTSTVQNILYNINQFFDFLELYSGEVGGFSNLISLKIDVPFSARKKGTVKKIFPSQLYAPFISYLYGLAEWVWWMEAFCKTREGLEYIKSHAEKNDNKRIWITADTGFVPIFWSEGQAFPINVIPRFIAPLHYRHMAHNPEVISPTILPNYINIAVVLCETGIRSGHVHWLDSRNFDQEVEREGFDPYSFNVTKLYVNTDKVNGPWFCYTSQSVIGVLDRQRKYQNSVIGENIKDLVDYSWNKNSPYLPIECLFALGSATRLNSKKLDGPSSPDGYVAKYRCLLYGFNVVMSQVDGFEPFMTLMETDAEINTERYFKSLFPAKIGTALYETDITPHSARSQVVSNYITLLPPNIIRSITGHATDAHLVYYAQLDNLTLDKARIDTSNVIKEGGHFHDKLISIRAEDINSSLRAAFDKNRANALKDFGATCFSSTQEERRQQRHLSGLIEVKKQPAEQIAFNSTHICPFNNCCPDDVKKEFEGVEQHKPCGRCFFAVKTVDHLPRIYGTIRSLMDECNDLDEYIQTAKENNVSWDLLQEASNRRRILADDIMGWTITTHCLESMAKELSSKDKWLVEKPELLSQHIERIVCKDGKLDSLLYRVAEAKNYAEFFTPTLKHQITKARTKLLAHTGQYNKLINDAPENYSLLDEFRGLIKSICQATNTNVAELSSYLDKPLDAIEPSNTPFRLLSLSGGGDA